eukprot:TRINITY_DN9398_c0_g1_i1.p1 TRINITY_DN9398_c0_g1~~TRINITY_DN9398_c0_g1_i1.p1  ORF type:complete len:313 (+),score=89.78 TRINITY_DN9398_c0_g1_i1:55-993(+)
MKRSYAVIGTGAVGGFYGARLQRAGHEVHFLLHSDYEHVKEHGIEVDSTEGSFTLSKVNAYKSVAEMPCCDVVVVALKTTMNGVLPALLPPLLKESSIVLVMQNGLDNEDDIALLAAGRVVLGGICYVGASKTGPGHIVHRVSNRVVLAEHRQAGATASVQLIKEDLERAGVTVVMAESLPLERWRKLIWNVPFNGLSVVLNADTHDLTHDPDAASMVECLMREVVAAAAACGHAIPAEFVAQILALTKRSEPCQTSMKADYVNHRPLEVEALLGNALRAVRKAGKEPTAIMPSMLMLYHELKFIDAHVCAQ